MGFRKMQAARLMKKSTKILFDCPFVNNRQYVHNYGATALHTPCGSSLCSSWFACPLHRHTLYFLSLDNMGEVHGGLWVKAALFPGVGALLKINFKTFEQFTSTELYKNPYQRKYLSVITVYKGSVRDIFLAVQWVMGLCPVCGSRGKSNSWEEGPRTRKSSPKQHRQLNTYTECVLAIKSAISCV